MPLIVSVMGTSHEEFASLVEGIGSRDEVAALELNVSCPNVHSGLVVGESPDEARSLLERAAAADLEAADREADPERPPGAGRRGGGRGRSRRRLADQHAAGRRDRSGHRAAVARGRARRALGLRGPGDRAEPGPGGRRRGRRPDRRDGRGRHRPPRSRPDRRAGASARCGRHRELPRPGGRVADRRGAGRIALRRESRLRAGNFSRRASNMGLRAQRRRGYTAAR